MEFRPDDEISKPSILWEKDALVIHGPVQNAKDFHRLRADLIKNKIISVNATANRTIFPIRQ